MTDARAQDNLYLRYVSIQVYKWASLLDRGMGQRAHSHLLMAPLTCQQGLDKEVVLEATKM
jgi:hypothetical protein